MAQLETLVSRIMDKTVRDGDCIIFTGAKAAGYGRVGHNEGGKHTTLQVHRVAYEYFVGPKTPSVAR
jgi:uncharacterized ferredoxin-like protein